MPELPDEVEGTPNRCELREESQAALVLTLHRRELCPGNERPQSNRVFALPRNAHSHNDLLATVKFGESSHTGPMGTDIY